MISIISLLLTLAGAHLVAKHIGEKRQIGYDQSFIWSFLFSPVGGLIIALLSKKIDTQKTTDIYSF